jgi:hypothetical protein
LAIVFHQQNPHAHVSCYGRAQSTRCGLSNWFQQRV